MHSISSFNIISVVVPESKVFLCILASAAEAAAVNLNGIKALLTDGLITFFVNGNSFFNNEPKSLQRNPPGCTILDNWVFDHLILSDV